MASLETDVTEYLLQKECDTYAADIFEDVFGESKRQDPNESPDFYREEMMERAWEAADGHQWVIYTYKALHLCAHCDTSNGESFVEEMGQKYTDLSRLATAIAFGEIRTRIEQAIDKLIEDYESQRQRTTRSQNNSRRN